MKYAGWFFLLLVGAVLVVAGVGSFLGDRAAAAPPLSLEGLLDEKLPEAAEPPPKLEVDNQACYVCHDNLKTDELVLDHGKEGTGCIDCHGASLAHRNDEDNITPPDKMFPTDAIDRMCAECHDTHDAPAQKVLVRWQERCPAKTNPKEIVCTDCHYQHRLKFRTVWWDKKTGELIVRKEGERTKVAEDLSTSETGDAGGQ